MTMKFALLPDDRDTLRSAQRSAQIKQLWEYVGAFWRVSAIQTNDEKQHGCHIITCDLIISRNDRASIYKTWDEWRGHWHPDRERIKVPIEFEVSPRYIPGEHSLDDPPIRSSWEYERVKLIHNQTGEQMYAIKCNGIFVYPVEFRTNPP